MSETNMRSNSEQGELRPEYQFDYSKAVRGKHADRLRKEHSNLVALDPDIATVFKDSQSVNHALRSMLNISHFLHKLESPSYSAMEKY